MMVCVVPPTGFEPALDRCSKGGRPHRSASIRSMGGRRAVSSTADGIRPGGTALEILGSLGRLSELEDTSEFLCQGCPDLLRGDEEELSSRIDVVQAAISEHLVQFVLECDRVF